MSEIFRNRGSAGMRTGNIPVVIMVAGTAIIATRCLGLLMLTGNLGLEGIAAFIQTSSQSWDLTLLFLAAMTLLFLELWCGFALLRGHPLARWAYLACQVLSAGYLFFATWQGFYPEMFALPGDSAGEILYQLMLHKLPDVLLLGLLFAPWASRRFFNGAG